MALTTFKRRVRSTSASSTSSICSGGTAAVTVARAFGIIFPPPEPAFALSQLCGHVHPPPQLDLSMQFGTEERVGCKSLHSYGRFFRVNMTNQVNLRYRRSSIGEGVQGMQRPDINHVPDYGGSRHNIVAQLISREDFQAGAIGREYGDYALGRCQVDPAIGRDGGGVIGAGRSRPRAPDHFAAGCIEAGDDAAVAHQKQATVIKQG